MAKNFCSKGNFEGLTQVTWFLLVLWFDISHTQTNLEQDTQRPIDWFMHINILTLPIMCTQQLSLLHWKDNLLIQKFTLERPIMFLLFKIYSFVEVCGCWNVAKVTIFILCFIFMWYEVLFLSYISYLCYMYFIIYLLYIYMYYVFLFSHYLILKLCDNIFIFIICKKLL